MPGRERPQISPNPQHLSGTGSKNATGKHQQDLPLPIVYWYYYAATQFQLCTAAPTAVQPRTANKAGQGVRAAVVRKYVSQQAAALA